jgi:aminoglycoside 3-N-acetyltransferase
MRESVKLFSTKATRALRRVATPISQRELHGALGSLIVNSPRVLFVHSSLSNLGRFTSGLSDVLSALGEYSETLCLPTFTYCYPARDGEVAPLFDPGSTRSKTGLLTEVFRAQQNVKRSIHSTHSIAASGPLSEELCANHYRQDSPCGVGTPYPKLLQHKAAVLMFGVNFHSYTLYHTAEDASGSQFAYENGTIDRLQVIDENGKKQECLSKRQSRAPRRFAEAGDLLERAGLVRRTRLGRGNLLFVPDSSKAHDFLVEKLRQTPDFLYQTCTRSLE